MVYNCSRSVLRKSHLAGRPSRGTPTRKSARRAKSESEEEEEEEIDDEEEEEEPVPKKRGRKAVKKTKPVDDEDEDQDSEEEEDAKPAKRKAAAAPAKRPGRPKREATKKGKFLLLTILNRTLLTFSFICYSQKDQG